MVSCVVFFFGPKHVDHVHITSQRSTHDSCVTLLHSVFGSSFRSDELSVEHVTTEISAHMHVEVPVVFQIIHKATSRRSEETQRAVTLLLHLDTGWSLSYLANHREDREDKFFHTISTDTDPNITSISSVLNSRRPSKNTIPTIIIVYTFVSADVCSVVHSSHNQIDFEYTSTGNLSSCFFILGGLISICSYSFWRRSNYFLSS